jgi:kynureninase
MQTAFTKLWPLLRRRIYNIRPQSRSEAMTTTRADCLALDSADPLRHARSRFVLPEGLIYLDGNSLGALPASTPGRIADVVAREWGEDLIRSWNKNGWIGMPVRLGARIAQLIGAGEDEAIVADSTSVNLFKLAAAALRTQAPRRVIVSERGNFPTDLYVLQGLEALMGGVVELKLVERHALMEAVDESVALLALTHIHYKTGEIHDMAALNARAHAVGALALWDLSHSAGAVELALNRDGADLAIGCGYKYLNGGPGAPAFLFVAREHQPNLHQPLTGWMGHAAPFEFSDTYRPADGMVRHLCGTPVILGMVALEEGLKTFDGIEMRQVQGKSAALGDLFLDLMEQRCADHGFLRCCPAQGQRRGSQVAFRHPGGYAIMQALIAEGVIGDFRAPDAIRFGFCPLYTRYADVWDAVETLSQIMIRETWRQDRFHVRAAVT